MRFAGGIDGEGPGQDLAGGKVPAATFFLPHREQQSGWQAQFLFGLCRGGLAGFAVDRSDAEWCGYGRTVKCPSGADGMSGTDPE